MEQKKSNLIGIVTSEIQKVVEKKADCDRVIWCMYQNEDRCFKVRIKYTKDWYSNWIDYRPLTPEEKQVMSAGLCNDCLQYYNDEKAKKQIKKLEEEDDKYS